MEYKKKLIEVALPLEAINKESAREKSIRHGHPSTLHLWWARRPLAACRAVLFASLVDDPSAHPDKFPEEQDQKKERQRLFKIIEDLVKWENINNPDVLKKAHDEIMKSTNGNPPPILDPFCGGGSIPLEAQRLGLKAYASDLNPVAVLITKALIEIPPKFSGKPPVNPEDNRNKLPGEKWKGASGLAADVRYYGKWMRDEAEKRIGHLYPKVKLPKEHGGGEATVIAWIWARTVKCPNPGCGAIMPLARSFWLSKKKGREAWIEVISDRRTKSTKYKVRPGKLRGEDGTVNRRGAYCIFCGSSVPFEYVRDEGKAGRMSSQLMAIVSEGNRGRHYVSPTMEQEETACKAIPKDVPDTELPERALGFRVQRYGMTKHKDLFTSRQLVALTTFSDLVSEARKKALADAIKAGMPDDSTGIEDGGVGATAYASAISTYLAFAVDKSADYWSGLCSWHTSRELIRNTFGRQALPMVWDFAECCPFSDSTGNWMACVDWIWKVVEKLPANTAGKTDQLDATTSIESIDGIIIATDPPYYDNIGYADLSDFFYVWLRRSLNHQFPLLFSTLQTPKAEELIATPYRHDGSRKAAEEYFEQGLAESFSIMYKRHNPDFPLTLFYAFKEAEKEENGDMVSTGWQTMLAGLLASGFAITGTWPMRSELGNRMVASGTNALASSVVLACRPRGKNAGMTTRRDFINELKRQLPKTLNTIQQGYIAPVDLAQSSIGLGMAVFSKYTKIIESDGTQMSIKTALSLINQILDEILSAQESEYDAYTRWAITWFGQFRYNAEKYDDALNIARAKGITVEGLVKAGIIDSKAGRVRLLKREELEKDWDPQTDKLLTIWEIAQYFIIGHNKGEKQVVALANKVGALAEAARDLAYRLYTICDKNGWTDEALDYNGLVVAWPQITGRVELTKKAGEQREIELKEK